MFEIFESVGSELGYSCLLQLSMDGPNINWRVFEMVQTSVQTQTSKELLNVGSCGLHVLHNSFRDGAGATNWNIEHALSSFWWLFKDSPARRDDFLEVTRSSIFPLKFCSHRWVENVPVAERALEIFPQMLAYVKAAKAGTIKEPRNKSFENVELVVQDTCVCGKVKFFSNHCKGDSPFVEILSS